MENAEMWLTPLLFLPGVALLIMSTSVRYGHIDTELHHLLRNKNAGAILDGHLLARATRFRNALVSLYVGFGLFSAASLLGGLTSIWTAASRWSVMSLTCLGIFSLVFASWQLIREAMHSLDVIRQHCREIE